MGVPSVPSRSVLSTSRADLVLARRMLATADIVSHRREGLGRVARHSLSVSIPYGTDHNTSSPQLARPHRPKHMGACTDAASGLTRLGRSVRDDGLVVGYESVLPRSGRNSVMVTDALARMTLAATLQQTVA